MLLGCTAYWLAYTSCIILLQQCWHCGMCCSGAAWRCWAHCQHTPAMLSLFAPLSCTAAPPPRSSPPGVRDTIRATLLGSLLFADAADLLAEWRHSGGRAAAAAAALSAPPAATSSSTDASSSTDHSPVVCRRLSDPHPALQLLLSVDVPAVVAVLAEATAGWDAVETDLRAAAGKPASELESVLVATQVGWASWGVCWLDRCSLTAVCSQELKVIWALSILSRCWWPRRCAGRRLVNLYTQG